MTLGERLRAFDGNGPGFAHLRIGLSLAILFWHSFGLPYGMQWTRTVPEFPFPSIVAALLPMFFALSGFLVMGSALRTNDVRTFLTFRVLRIVPALFTEIALSALVLGPLLTAIPLADYFNSREFLEYFGSMIGRVRYILPGLFLSNPAPRVVNGALWTVGPEILCYVLIAFAMVAGFFSKPRLMLLATALYLVVCLASDPWDAAPVYEILPTKTLILSFLTGNGIFLYRDRLPYSPWLTLAVFLASLVCIAIAQFDVAHAAVYPAAIGLAYVAASIGLMKLPPLPFFHRGDYSYGVYIYGFPIQQAIVHFFPGHRDWWFVFAVSLPITLLFAVASWHLVEGPALALRKTLLRAKTTARAVSYSGWKQTGAVTACLLLYGTFVADASSVFPLRQIGHSLIGRADVRQDAPLIRPQF